MALIPPFMIDCVVAIGFSLPGGTVTWTGTGFLYGKRTGTDPQTGTGNYTVFLVTNRHVLFGQQLAHIRLNPIISSPAKEFPVSLIDQHGNPTWYSHNDPDIDVAAVLIDAGILLGQGIQFQVFLDDLHLLPFTRAQQEGLSEGDGVFILGFPMGNVGAERNYVVVRQGAIARIRDAYAGVAKQFLLDAPVFPGNSGGPVVTRPELTAIDGTTPIKSAWLIGMVAAYLPYQDVAISQQTQRPRVIFEENSGLAAAIPIDHIIEVVETAYLALASTPP